MIVPDPSDESLERHLETLKKDFPQVHRVILAVLESSKKQGERLEQTLEELRKEREEPPLLGESNDTVPVLPASTNYAQMLQNSQEQWKTHERLNREWGALKSEFGDWTNTYKAKPPRSLQDEYDLLAENAALRSENERLRSAQQTTSDHIVDANKKVEPVASVNSIRGSIGQGTINILIKDGLNPGDYLYTHPAHPSELIAAANEVAVCFRKAKSNWLSKDQLRSLHKLCDVLDKLK